MVYKYLLSIIFAFLLFSYSYSQIGNNSWSHKDKNGNIGIDNYDSLLSYVASLIYYTEGENIEPYLNSVHTIGLQKGKTEMEIQYDLANILTKNGHTNILYGYGISLYNRLIEFSEKNHNDTLLYRLLMEISSVYFLKDEYTKADSILINLRDRFISKPINYNEYQVYNLLGAIKLRLRQYVEAFKYLKLADHLSKKKDEKLVIKLLLAGFYFTIQDTLDAKIILKEIDKDYSDHIKYNLDYLILKINLKLFSNPKDELSKLEEYAKYYEKYHDFNYNTVLSIYINTFKNYFGLDSLMYTLKNNKFSFKTGLSSRQLKLLIQKLNVEQIKDYNSIEYRTENKRLDSSFLGNNRISFDPSYTGDFYAAKFKYYKNIKNYDSAYLAGQILIKKYLTSGMFNEAQDLIRSCVEIGLELNDPNKIKTSYLLLNSVNDSITSRTNYFSLIKDQIADFKEKERLNKEKKEESDRLQLSLIIISSIVLTSLIFIIILSLKPYSVHENKIKYIVIINTVLFCEAALLILEYCIHRLTHEIVIWIYIIKILLLAGLAFLLYKYIEKLLQRMYEYSNKNNLINIIKENWTSLVSKIKKSKNKIKKERLKNKTKLNKLQIKK